MKRPEPYTTEQRQRIAEALRAGDVPECPRCGSRLDQWSVPPRPDVSYVRDRVWMVCSPCSRSVVLDRFDPKG